ncbi:hypothetical protein HKX48_008010 [Thoreauomyces humboldtii]|nr:hypothetical protein HKX48_008010 [Thoreauomyces humboldtii]
MATKASTTTVLDPFARPTTVSPSCLATAEYPVPETLDTIIRNPGVPRATIAPSAEHPNGSTDGKKQFTPLQQHVEFFDRNNDGVITLVETFKGFYALGFNVIFCLLAMAIIHGGFSYPSLDGWIPNPTLPIYVKNIHRCLHGSDTGTYDTEGRYIPQRFEEVLSKYDVGNKGGLDFSDIMRMTREIRNFMDFFGMFANKFEWGTLWLLCRNENGLITKEQIRRCYDGTLFYHIEAERLRAKQDRVNAKKINNLKVKST